MTIRYAVLISLTAAIFTGCGQKDNQPAPGPEKPSVTPPIPALSAADLLSRNPDTVLATVNGKEFTLAQANEEIDIRIRARNARQPADTNTTNPRVELLGRVVDQFVMRRLLLDEADRRGITLTDEDEAAAFDHIKKQLPPDKSLEQVMADSPMGADRMREEVLTGLRINKLIKQVVPHNPKVTDEDVAAFLAQNPDAKFPESVSAHHILIKISEGDDEAAKAEKLATITKLREELVAGADFEELAKAHSDCPSSQRGGDLGTFRSGQMVKPFEEAAFSQAPGAIGEVVETKFGYHIIRVDAHHDAGDIPTERVEKLIKKQKGKAVYEQFLSDLRSKANITFPATEW